MRKILGILFLLSVVLSSLAQGNGFDLQLMSEADITGSSRYIGLGGAMAALGGDVSAVKDNPAALGVYRRSEVSMSFGLEPGRCMTPTENSTTFSYSVPELAWVFTFNKDNRKTGVLSNTIMISYQRLRTIRGEWKMSCANQPYSQTDLMAGQSNGLLVSDLNSDNAYDDANVGWMSKMGYDAYLIDPVTEGGTEWVSLEDGKVDNALHVKESGAINSYMFGWGMNISNRWNVGLSTSIVTVSYRKNGIYEESFESGNSYQLVSSMSASGIGINFNAGVIYRPIPRLRLAASLQTPTWTSMNYKCNGEIYSRITTTEGTTPYSSSPSDYYSEDRKHHMPFRSVVGLAYAFGNKGLLSAEYDYQHGQYANMRDEHLLKLGGEVVVKNNCFIDLGYSLKAYGRYASGEDFFLPSYNSARVDTDFRHGCLKHYASAGVSFRNRYFIAGTAYQFAYQKMEFYAHADQTMPTSCSNRTHRIVFTLAWRYRR